MFIWCFWLLYGANAKRVWIKTAQPSRHVRHLAMAGRKLWLKLGFNQIGLWELEVFNTNSNGYLWLVCCFKTDLSIERQLGLLEEMFFVFWFFAFKRVPNLWQEATVETWNAGIWTEDSGFNGCQQVQAVALRWLLHISLNDKLVLQRSQTRDLLGFCMSWLKAMIPFGEEVRRHGMPHGSNQWFALLYLLVLVFEVVKEDGTRADDPGGFMQKQVPPCLVEVDFRWWLQTWRWIDHVRGYFKVGRQI